MSLYRASFSRRLIWYKTNHDYPLLLKDYMVNKIRICYYSWSQTKQKKHFNIRLMKNQKKKSKVSPTIILIKMTFIYFYRYIYRIQENIRSRVIFTPFALLVYEQIEDWVHCIGSNNIFRSRLCLDEFKIGRNCL